MANVANAAEYIGGVRTDGSGLSRYLTLHEAEGGGYVTVTFYVKVHTTTGLIEIYADNTTNIRWFALGYWTNVDFTEAWTQLTCSGTGAFEDETLAQTNTVYAITAVNAEEENNNVGVRANGSSIDRYYNMHEAEAGGVEAMTWIVKTDSSGIIDLRVEDTTNNYFYNQGYFGNTLDFVEGWTQYSPASTGWQDADISASLDQDGRYVVFFAGHGESIYEYNCGVRANGGAIGNRYILVHEGEDVTTTADNVEFVGFTATVLSDANGIIDIYVPATLTDYNMFMGYFKPAGQLSPLNLTEASYIRHITGHPAKVWTAKTVRSETPYIRHVSGAPARVWTAKMSLIDTPIINHITVVPFLSKILSFISAIVMSHGSLTDTGGLFVNGLETNDWTGWSSHSGNVVISSAAPHHGTYHLRYTPGTTTSDAVATTTAVNKAYLRYYLKLNEAPVEGAIMLAGVYATSATTLLLRLYLTKSGGNLKWYMNYRKAGTWVSTAESSMQYMTVGEYRCVEVMIDCSTNDGDLDGAYKLYVDGVEVSDISVSGVDTDSTTVSIFKLSYWENSTNELNFDVDCVKIAETYIGPHGVGFPSTIWTAKKDLPESPVIHDATLRDVWQAKKFIPAEILTLAGTLTRAWSSVRAWLETLNLIDILDNVYTPGGGVIYRTWTETVDLISSFSKTTWTSYKNIMETIVLLIPLSRVWSIKKSLTDTSVIHHISDLPKNITSKFIENPWLRHTYSTVKTWVKSYTEQSWIRHTGYPTRIWSAKKKLEDSPYIRHTGFPTKIWTAKKSLTDAIFNRHTGFPTRIWTAKKSISEQPYIRHTGFPTRIWTIYKTLTGTINLITNFDYWKATVTYKTLTEAVNIASLYLRKWTVVRGISNTINLSSLLSRSWSIIRKFVDTFNLVGTVSSYIIKFLSMVNNLNISSTISKVWNIARSIQQTQILTGSIARIWAAKRSITQSTNIGSDMKKVWTIKRLLSGSINLSDIKSKIWSIGKTLLQTLDLRDFVNVQGAVKYIQAAEAMILGSTVVAYFVRYITGLEHFILSGSILSKSILMQLGEILSLSITGFFNEISTRVKTLRIRVIGSSIRTVNMITDGKRLVDMSYMYSYNAVYMYGKIVGKIKRALSGA